MNCLDEKVAYLKSKGVQFETDPTDQPWLWREAQLVDIDSNHIVFYHTAKNKKYLPWRKK